jgi:hypothetical protein
MKDKETDFFVTINMFLIPLGYSRKKKSWIRDEEETVWVISFQKSQYSCQYYVNLAIFLRSIDIFDVHKTENGQIQLRIEQLCDDDRSVSSLFNLDIDMDDDLRYKGIKDIFQTKVIPFFEDNKTYSAIAANYRNGLLNKFLIMRELYYMLNPSALS